MAEDGTGIDEPGLLFSNVARVDLRPAEGGIDGDLDGFSNRFEVEDESSSRKGGEARGSVKNVVMFERISPLLSLRKCVLGFE